MVSGFAEPTNFGSFLISIYIIFSEKRKYFLILIILLCSFLIISKAVILVVFVIIPVIKSVKKLFPNILYSQIYLLMFAGMFFVAFIIDKLDLSHGALAHIIGYYTGMDSLLSGNIFGFGVGKAGNYSSNQAIGAESGLGGMLAQIGIATFFFIAFFYKLLRCIEYDEKKNHCVIMLIISWIFIFIFSESAFGISGNILFWAYPGIYFNKINQKKN
jgi:hypothetical protein